MTNPTVPIHPRRAMTRAEKVQRWNECEQCCTICGEGCLPYGPTIIWDHRIALALGGSNDLTNMEPNHAAKCAAEKTRRDRQAIARAQRLERKHNGTARKPNRTIASRPFGKFSRKIVGRGFERRAK